MASNKNDLEVLLDMEYKIIVPFNQFKESMNVLQEINNSKITEGKNVNAKCETSFHKNIELFRKH